jgi:MYXO-CTERM domain-containing protein
MFKKFLSILIFLSLTTTPAHAETGYRYWGYFQATSGATSWTPAMTGPSVEVKDGDVEGWTFTASAADIPATSPMMDPDFAELCGETSEVSGKVRVGLVVDFGVGEIAPEGETPREFFSDCVVVPQGSVGLDVLEAVLDVRAADSGLICGIAGYPAQECGAEIDMDILAAPINDIAPVSDTESSSGNSPALLALAVVALLVGLVAVRRRKKS